LGKIIANGFAMVRLGKIIANGFAMVRLCTLGIVSVSWLF